MIYSNVPPSSNHAGSCMAECDSTSETTYMNETEEIGSVTEPSEEIVVAAWPSHCGDHAGSHAVSAVDEVGGPGGV